jgi:hypothetical protein
MPDDVIQGAEGINDGNPPAEGTPPEGTLPEGTPQIAGNETDWYWDKENGIKGEGPRPDHLLPKYDDVKNQSKAYSELEGKFGAFTGAPKDGYVTEDLSNELKENGFELDTEDPLFQEFTEFAKKSNMSQEYYNEGIKIYALGKIADGQIMEDFKTQQIEALGPEGPKMMQNMTDWAKANLSEEDYQGFLEAFPTTGSIKAGLRLIAMTQGQTLSPQGAEGKAGITEQEVKDLLFAKDEHGNRLINTDPAHRARYEEARDRFWGTHRDIEMIG